LSAGLLIAPLTWLVAELVGYYFAARSCDPVGGVPFMGTAHASTTHLIIEGCAAIIAAVGGAIALTNWRATRELGNPGDPPALGRARFMSLTGLVVSGVMLLGIILFGLPGFVVNACGHGP
jgi:hypothetical protein